MPESPNAWKVYERLVADDVDAGVAALIEASLDGAPALAAALAGPSDAPRAARPAPPPPPAPKQVFLRALEVAGFRGVGPDVRVDLPPGPGLTILLGRNGSGKSSLAEAAELLLTDDSLRWRGRTPASEWTAGWRNLHHTGPARIRATFTQDGTKGSVVLTRAWAVGAALTDGQTTVRVGPEDVADRAALGWSDALRTCRPFLSHNELSHALDSGPSKLFDALSGLLGVDDVAAARNLLSEAKKQRENQSKDVKARATELRATAAALNAPWSSRCAELLAAKVPDLDAIETAALTQADDVDDATVRPLQRAANLAAPDADAVLTVATRLQDALAAEAALAGSRAAQDDVTARVIEAALAWHDGHGGADCPVCGTADTIGPAWRVAAAAQLADLRASARGVAAAAEARVAALRGARAVLTSVSAPPDVDLPGLADARAAYAAWSAAPDAPAALPDHLLSCVTRLTEAYAALKAEASARLDDLHAAWRPFQRQLEAWLDSARASARDVDLTKRLKKAEDWMKDAEDALRAEAFEPIKRKTQETWARLRQGSNVEVADITLRGAGKARHVDVDVAVDGTRGVALGVMSQGELNALALSIFLPRLVRPDSPFRFVLVDDPVQAMDPAKVDGLATVLAEAAQTHQVVVFTHDTRLQDAVRRLGLSATFLLVRRQTASRVTVTETSGPVEQHLSDAKHLLHQRDALGDDVVRELVPGLCRAAVEAAMVERIWRDALARGVPHDDVEDGLRAAPSLGQLAPLALFGDANRGADVLSHLNHAHGPWSADVFQDLKRFAHGGAPPSVSLADLLRDTQRLAQAVAR
jgi:predicted ATPase